MQHTRAPHFHATDGPVKVIDPMSFREVEALRKKHESA
jgi:hypothetical protein